MLRCLASGVLTYERFLLRRTSAVYVSLISIELWTSSAFVLPPPSNEQTVPVYKASILVHLVRARFSSRSCAPDEYGRTKKMITRYPFSSTKR